MKIINFKTLINNLQATKKTLIKNKTFKHKIYQDIKISDKNLNKMKEITFKKDFKRTN